MKILIVDDERQLAEALQEVLKRNNCLSDAVFDGEDGLNYALTDDYDLIILDVMLPKKSGLEVIKGIRKAKLSVPVLMLSAKSQVPDRIAGLDYGADDYLTKPFSAEELLARVRALTRRKGEFVGDNPEVKGVILDKGSMELISGAKRVKLGLKEFLIMEILFANAERVTSKERLIEKVWGYDFDGEYNTVEVYISFLRKKLAAINAALEIKAVRGIGYCIESN